MIPEYTTKLFTDVWDNHTDFLIDYQTNEIGQPLSEQSVIRLFYLLYAKYGNNPIANYDELQFKYKLWSIIYQYGPTWEKRLEIQAKLRDLTDEDIIKGTKAIYNHAFNPSSDPGIDTELATINEQNTTNYKKSKLEAYSILWDSLRTDVTEAFLKHFAVLFKKVVAPECGPYYITEVDEDE